MPQCSEHKNTVNLFSLALWWYSNSPLPLLCLLPLCPLPTRSPAFSPTCSYSVVLVLFIQVLFSARNAFPQLTSIHLSKLSSRDTSSKKLPRPLPCPTPTPTLSSVIRALTTLLVSVPILSLSSWVARPYKISLPGWLHEWMTNEQTHINSQNQGAL